LLYLPVNILTVGNPTNPVQQHHPLDRTSDAYFWYWLTDSPQETQGSYATFSFTGVTQVYYMGYGLLASKPDTMMDIVFDGTLYRVNESMPSTDRAQAIIWNIGSLDPQTTHTIVCRKSSETNSTDRMDVNVDAFM
jgi:hypothetical protein